MARRGKALFRGASVLMQKQKRPEALFFGHLALEKTLKAIITLQTSSTPQPIHHLSRLARAAAILLSKKQEDDFKIITSFNIAGRYDDEKKSFYRQCTPSFSRRWFMAIKKYYLWLNEEFQTK